MHSLQLRERDRETKHKASNILRNSIVYTKHEQLQRRELLQSKREPVTKYDDLRNVFKWGPSLKRVPEAQVALRSAKLPQGLKPVLLKIAGIDATQGEFTPPAEPAYAEIAALTSLPVGVQIAPHPRSTQVCKDPPTRNMSIPCSMAHWRDMMKGAHMVAAAADRKSSRFAATVLGFEVDPHTVAPGAEPK
ncbi:hypothetical protein HK105_202824 [Polyrhizophydium stewartii]|uniref:Uncharacterized protein n=1 Tax=Polyrhizophydium stewartii TaxID=2732419 RepID=A0ABR4NDH0_9FUNG